MPIPDLRHHSLAHMERLRIHPTIVEPVFTGSCAMSNCNARCCREGVFLDPVERDRILQYAPLIQKHLEPHQPNDPSMWFDNEREVDADFPSGYAVGTRKMEYGCVFLDTRGWCALQKTAVAEGMHKWAIKPFYCIAYPITIQEGVLTVDEPAFTGRTECCSRIPNGVQTALEVCSEELEFLIGREGFAELKQHAQPQQE